MAHFKIFQITSEKKHETIGEAVAGDGWAKIEKPIKRPPDIEGPDGKAWLCNIDVACERLGIKRSETAMIAIWVIEAPKAHPIWHSYSLDVRHLRPNPGEDLHIYIPLATHEILLSALVPDCDRETAIAGGASLVHLVPHNFAAQLVEISDELALGRVRCAVEMICAGRLSPDTDYTSDWIRLFGHAMIKEEFR